MTSSLIKHKNSPHQHDENFDKKDKNIHNKKYDRF